ncbi:MAG: DUF3576 domain-containing protein [Rhodobacteraceae bacterium]|nr:DUF3576 domain-containing protein [Paracoccaceae bacterium]
MKPAKLGNLTAMLVCCTALAACGGRGLGPVTVGGNSEAPATITDSPRETGNVEGGSSIWDLFGPDTAEQTVAVNKYIWNASLDVLNFLPLEMVDPFTGVISTGYGTPPGGGRAYRATIHIKDPALEARSLRIALQTRGGPVSAGTTRAIEDAILSRARQLRIADNKF